MIVERCKGKPKFAVKHNRRKENLSLYLIDKPPYPCRTSAELNDGLLSIIGEAPTDKNCLIFDLSTYESCYKSVKRWVKRAGIDKHMSWHCARHSFAVNILNNGANIKTVASLLGHSGLKHTEKYTRAVDKLKEEAINSLSELKF